MMTRTGVTVMVCAAGLLLAGCGDEESTQTGEPVVGTVVQTDLSGTEWMLSYHYNPVHPQRGDDVYYEYPILFHADNVLGIRSPFVSATVSHLYIVYNGTNIVLNLFGNGADLNMAFGGSIHAGQWHVSGWGFRSVNSLSWQWRATRAR